MDKSKEELEKLAKGFAENAAHAKINFLGMHLDT